MVRIGYARVSSTGQKLDVQLDKLQHDGCTTIFKEKATGTNQNRNELKACLKYLRENDVLVITKLDRLARSTLHLTQIANDLEQRKIDLVVLDQNIDTTTPTGKLLFNMLASISEFETALRKERQTDGIAKAKEKGVKFGAKAKLTEHQINEMCLERKAGVKIKDLMAKYNLSKASVYRLLNN